MKNLHKRYKSVFIALAVTFALFLIRQPAFSQFKPVKFERDSLENGLQIIYNVDNSAPVIATVVHYRVGSKDEIPGKTGYAHFFEHLMFEATSNIPRASIDKYIQEAGGTLNAHTSWDETVFFFKLPSNESRLALWIESQRMRGLKVDSIGVETQRGVVMEELKMRTDNQPYGTLLNKVCENLFGGSNYGWATIGYLKDLEKAAISDFKTFYDKHYVPVNAVLVISGDFNIKDMKEYVREYFGSIPRLPAPERGEFKMPPLEKGYRETVEDAKAQLPAIFITYRGTKLGEPDYYPLTMLTNILASGESSRLYQRLINKEQAAVATALLPISLEYSGAVLLYGIPQVGKDIELVEKLMNEEIDKLIKEGVTDEELSKAKNINEANIVSGKKNVLDKAQDLARYFSYYGDPGLINKEIDRFNSVTKEDILRVAKKYLGTDKKVVLIYQPKAAQ